MALCKSIASRQGLKARNAVIDYLVDAKKKRHGQMDIETVGIGSVSARVIKSAMETVDRAFGQTSGRRYFHFTLSWAREEDPSYAQVMDVARRLCSEGVLKNHQILIVVHKNTGNPHAHLLVNSTSPLDGRKLHMDPKDLKDMKDRLLEISRDVGIENVIDPKDRPRDGVSGKSKYAHLLLDGAMKGKYESWLLDMALAIRTVGADVAGLDLEGAENAIIHELNQSRISWVRRGKNEVYTDAEGHKVRASRLQKIFGRSFLMNDIINDWQKRRADAALDDEIADMMKDFSESERRPSKARAERIR